MVGTRIRECRKASGLTAKEIVQQTKIPLSTLYYWEQNDTNSSDATSEAKLRLAEALGVSVAYLMGETDDKKVEHRGVQHKKNFMLLEEQGLPVPLFERWGSCGRGEWISDSPEPPTEMLWVPKSQVGTIDDSKPPFSIIATGDSMEEADIHEGDKLIINPAEEVRNGDVAVVEYLGDCYVKWVIYDIRGNVELRSSNKFYDSIFIARTDLAKNPELFKVVGKVMFAFRTNRPRRAQG